MAPVKVKHNGSGMLVTTNFRGLPQGNVFRTQNKTKLRLWHLTISIKICIFLFSYFLEWTISIYFLSGYLHHYPVHWYCYIVLSDKFNYIYLQGIYNWPLSWPLWGQLMRRYCLVQSLVYHLPFSTSCFIVLHSFTCYRQSSVYC